MTNRGYISQDRDNIDIQSVTEFTRLIHETVDVDRLAGFYAEDAARIGPHTPGVFHGTEEIRAGFEQSLKDVTERRVELDLNVVTNGVMASWRHPTVNSSSPSERPMAARPKRPALARNIP